MRRGTLREARIPVEVVLGDTALTVENLSSIGEGSIIELQALAGEPVFVRAAGSFIAKGEVVVIDENFGVRITEMLSSEE